MLYYLYSDSKTNEKKLVSNFHDCLLQLFNQINRMRTSDPTEAGPSSRDLTPALQYQEKKQRNFSCFYSNSYLYLHISRFLQERNIMNMSQVFFTAATQEIVAALSEKSREELVSLESREFSLLWKLVFNLEGRQELHKSIFRFLLLRPNHALIDSLVSLSFFSKVYQNEENFNDHLDFIASFLYNLGLTEEDTSGDQKLVVDYVLKVIRDKSFVGFLDQLERFDSFVKAQFSSPTDAQATKVCPLTFYGSYFPANELSCLEKRYVKAQGQFYEDFIEFHLKNWFESVKNKNSAFEINIKEPLAIKNMIDDFYAIGNASIQVLGEQFPQEKSMMDTNVPKVSLKSSLDAKSEFISYHSIREFDDFVKKSKNIRIFEMSQMKLSSKDKQPPDFLGLERIQLLEGYILANQQRVNVFKATVRYTEHLKRIRENLDLMNMYSPFVVQYLG